MCMLRRNALIRLEERTGIKPPHKMTTAELADAAGRDRGSRLQQELLELGQRKGPDVLTGLLAAAGGADKDGRQTALDLMTSHIAGQGIEFTQKELKDDRADARRSAARAAAKYPSLIGDLVPLLGDPEGDVAAAAHQSLTKASGGQDFGPDSMTTADIEAAQKKWQAWWDKERGK